MKTYSVKELAELAGISVRTLHHYDQIDLLKPAFRTEKGYRFYGREELFLLQQILFYRELGFTLKQIDAIINDSDFNLLLALESHKKELKQKAKNVRELLRTVDKTIEELKNKKMMKDEEIYEGFSKEEIRDIRKEVTERWGKEELSTVEERIRNLGLIGWKDEKKKGEEVNQLLADLIDLPYDHVQVQRAIELHFRYLNLFYPVSKERYSALGKMYVSDERFKAYYDEYADGLASFLNEGIQVFCANDLKT